MAQSPFGKLKSELASALAAAMESLGYDPKNLTNTIDFSRGLGDISCSVAFRVAKQHPGNPDDIASGIVKKLPENEMIKNITVDKGYINFQIDRSRFTKDTLDYAYSISRNEPISNIGNGDRVIIEYPSANPAHPLHVGQVRSALLGDCISNIHEACGYTVEREDYIDDLGLQVAQALWGMMNKEKLGLTFDPKKKFDHSLGDAYVATNKYLAEHKEVEEEIRDLMQLMEQNATSESELSRKQSEEYVKAERETLFSYMIYHDLMVWESDVIRNMLLEKSLDMLKEKGLTETPKDGKYANCVIINLNKLGTLPLEFKGLREEAKVLIRSNGTPNYLAKDIAFHMWKLGILQNTFKYSKFMEKQPNGKPLYTTGSEGTIMNFGGAKKIVNAIDARQSSEQAMIKLIFNALGMKKEAEGFNHLAYGVVELEGGALAGRKGTWVGYTADDLLRETTEKALTLIGERFKMDDKEKAETARNVALGAIRFEFMRFSPEKIITFSWERALNFQGSSGPYCQYMYARAIRLLEDSKMSGRPIFDAAEITTDAEFVLVKLLSRLNETVEKACIELRPNTVSEYFIDLSSAFSNFYEQMPIFKGADEKQKQARLALVLAFANTLRYALGLFGIPVVNRM